MGHISAMFLHHATKLSGGHTVSSVRKRLLRNRRWNQEWWHPLCLCQETYFSSGGSSHSLLEDNKQNQSSKTFKVLEFSVTDSTPEDRRKNGIIYVATSNDNTKARKAATLGWQREQSNEAIGSIEPKRFSDQIYSHVLTHFLPAKYPSGVSPGYLRFVGYCFTASVAGSAAMVLSTQTLLLAVGVVGAGSGSVHQASVMAGAFNWVLKDGIGQFGGVLFASQMGKTRAFDADPKRWRMIAALSLDCATLMEILSPLVSSNLVLPLASAANIGKNIGFLTASASRAAIHQSLAIAGNLGDVTAKAASQSIVASLLGTTVGIGLSSLLSHEVYNFCLGFCVLTVIHQGCNYASLKSVALLHLNRHRLHIVMDHYLQSTNSSNEERGHVLSPSAVAQKEIYFPLISGDDSHSWLSVGRSLTEVLPSPSDLNLNIPSETAYILTVVPKKNDDQKKQEGSMDRLMVQIVFLEDASGEDLIRGMMHAYMVRAEFMEGRNGMTNSDEFQSSAIVDNTYVQVKEQFPIFLQEFKEQGWVTDTELTTIEDSNSRRLRIEKPVDD